TASEPERRVVPADGESDISAPRWFPGLAGTSSITDDFHFGFQINSALRPCATSNQFDQLQNVLGSGGAVVDNKIAVLGGDESTADAGSFQAQLINEFASGDRAGVLENTTRARRGRLRVPTFAAECVHPLRDQLGIVGMTSQDGPERNARFKHWATPILDVHFRPRPFLDAPVLVHQPD